MNIISNYQATRAATEIGSTGILPDELLKIIISNVALDVFASCHLVCKRWHEVASDPALEKILIYRQIAFGPEKWTQHFGEGIVTSEDSEKAFNSLTDEIVRYLKSPCQASVKSGKHVLHTHTLVWMPQITLNRLEAIAKVFFDRTTSVLFSPNYIVNEYRDKPSVPSWVLMTKNILVESLGTSVYAQNKMIRELSVRAGVGYSYPELLEVEVSILTQCVSPERRKCLFGQDDVKNMDFETTTEYSTAFKLSWAEFRREFNVFIKFNENIDPSCGVPAALRFLSRDS